MRITAIELENFKGIRERQRIELAPITLLFGPNSSGKSTILQALLYTWEILERRNLDPDRTLLGGQHVDLGGFANLVHGHDLSREITLGFELDLGKDSLPDYANDAHEYDLPGPPLDAPDPDRYLNDVKFVRVEIDLAWSETLGRPVVHLYRVHANGHFAAEITSQLDGRNVTLSRADMSNPAFQERVVMQGFDPESGESVGDAEESLRNNPAGELLSNEGQKTGEAGMIALNLALSGFADAMPGLGKSFSITPEKDFPGDAETGSYVYWFTDSILSGLLVGPLDLLRKHLGQLRYIGPLREVPTRQPAQVRSPDPSRWANGAAAWDLLRGADDVLVSRINGWLGMARLNTGYSIKVDRFREVPVDHVVSVSILSPEMLFEEEVQADFRKLPIRARVRFRDENGLELLPQDIGVGISQVLPIVVAGLHQDSGILTVEQPELHIHPALQVVLGDLFASRIHESEATFLLETHSEHLMLRLLRRVRETHDNELPPGAPSLKPEDLAVHYAENSEDGVTLTKLRVDEDGDFKDRWPRGFFEERAGELF